MYSGGTEVLDRAARPEETSTFHKEANERMDGPLPLTLHHLLPLCLAERPFLSGTAIRLLLYASLASVLR